MKIVDCQISMDAEFSRNNKQETSTRIDVTRRQAQWAPPPGGTSEAVFAIGSEQRDHVDISYEARQALAQHTRNEFESRSLVTDLEGTRTHLLREHTLVESLSAMVMEQQVALSGTGTVRSGTGPISRNPDAGIQTLSMLQTSLPAQNTTITAAVYNREVRESDEQFDLHASGVIKTQDGRAVDFDMRLSMQHNMSSVAEESFLMTQRRESGDMTDPLMIQLEGNLPELSDTVFTFDLDNDGKAENISMLKKGSAFLSLDKNKNGRIDSGGELFGPASGNGFADLSAYDSDKSNWIDENDAIFEALSLWVKDDSGRDELKGLKEMGIGAIYLGRLRGDMTMADEVGNTLGRLRQTGFYIKEDGSVKTVQQIDLASQSATGELDEKGPKVDSLVQNTASQIEKTLDGVDQLNTVLRNLENRISGMRQSMKEHLTHGKAKKIPCTPVERLIQLMEGSKTKMPRALDKTESSPTHRLGDHPGYRRKAR